MGNRQYSTADQEPNQYYYYRPHHLGVSSTGVSIGPRRSHQGRTRTRNGPYTSNHAQELVVRAAPSPLNRASAPTSRNSEVRADMMFFKDPRSPVARGEHRNQVRDFAAC